VAALASLRASAKRDEGGVGHFGVGFTAVLALSDRPSLVSTTGGVRFSAADTRRAVAGLGVAGLDAELRRRAGHVPVLRLPWPTESDQVPPDGFASQVRLPLRDDVGADDVAAVLSVETALDLLWALPELTSISMPGFRVHREDGGDGPDGVITIRIDRADAGPAGAADAEPELRRFRTATGTGRLPGDLLAGRPVEERGRDRWRLTWVLPLDPAGRPDPQRRTMIGAPTPTAEPLTLPARLVGSLPVDESRSRIAEGPLADHLVGAAARVYRELVLALPGDQRAALLPAGGFPAGPLDGALHEAVRRELERTAFLPGADGAPLRPDRALLIPGVAGPAAARIVEAMPGLVPWPDRADVVDRLRGLGVSVRPVTTVPAALAALERPAAFWQDVYAALAHAGTEELADLPVPRRGGGNLIGCRGVLLAVDGPGAVPADLMDRAARLLPGLRLAADGVDHPLLRRLGAEPADAAALLLDPALADQIRARLDEAEFADPDPAELHEFATLVLDLLAVQGADAAEPGQHDAGGVLADVLLTDTDGEAWPAGSLLLPAAPLASVLVADADLPQVGSEWIGRYGAELLAGVGVRSGFTVRRYPLPPDDVDLPDADRWWDRAGSSGPLSGPAGTEPARPDPAPPGDTFQAVPDLDLVDPAEWPAALSMLAGDRDTRDALRPSGSAPSYTAWWRSEHARVRGVPLSGWRTRDAVELAGLYDALPVPLPDDVAADLGVLRTLQQAAARPGELLARWADARRAVPPGRVPVTTRVLVAALAERPDGATGGPDLPSGTGGAVELPDGVRTLAGTVAPADDAAVLDLPWLAQLIDPALLVAGGGDPGRTAAVLDLDLASERWPAEPVTGRPGRQTTLGQLAPAAACLGLIGRPDLADLAVTVHDRLEVRPGPLGGDGEPSRGPAAPTGSHPVRWWMDGDRLLLDGSADGIARAVAHLAGRWSARHELLVIARGDRVERAESGLD
jgi:hypothetical protein